MSEKQWPKCQPNPKVCTRISVPESTVRFPGTDDPDAGVWSRQVTVSDAHRERPGHVNYTRTDIAEAKIAELEAERDALRERLTQSERARYHEHIVAEDALRERDALRARIEGAPKVVAKAGAWDVAPDAAFLSMMLPRNYAGKRVALVVLGDDDD